MRRKVCPKKWGSGRCEFEHRPSKTLLSISFHHPVPLPTQTHPCCVTERRARPASSFVHPGMWDILTSWLFIDSTQLRVPPVALSLSHSGVCAGVCVCVFVSTALSLLSAKQALPRTRVSARKRKPETPRRTPVPETTGTPSRSLLEGVSRIESFPERLHSFSAEMVKYVSWLLLWQCPGRWGNKGATRLILENTETKNASLDKQDISH